MIVQGSFEWQVARAGSLGASCFYEILTKTKDGGWGASRKNLMGRLIAERLTGMPLENFASAAMRWGTLTEPDARTAYSFYTGSHVEQIGIVYHPTILGSHASPDGYVEADGMVEFKCPETATHIETLLSKKIDSKYVTQMQWQMSVTGRQWVDFVSYDPRMPEEMQIFIKRVKRDDSVIEALQNAARAFIFEMDTKVALLCKEMGVPVPERRRMDEDFDLELVA